MTPEQLAAIEAHRAFLVRAHRMSCSDPSDPSRATTYSESSNAIDTLLALVREQQAQLEAVRELHVAEGNGNCVVCWDFNNDTDVRFPCPTLEATK